MTDPASPFSLICRVQKRLFALPLEHVVEIMRPLATNAVAGAPEFVSGVAVVRGSPMVVVDTARLLGDARADPSRFVTVRAGERCMTLAVDQVMGVRAVPREALHEVPRLLQEAGDGVVAALSMLDTQLLLVLESTRILPAAFLANPSGSAS